MKPDGERGKDGMQGREGGESSGLLGSGANSGVGQPPNKPFLFGCPREETH